MAHVHNVGRFPPNAVGTTFNFSLALDGALVHRLGVWGGDAQLTGIQVWRTNDVNMHLFGRRGTFYEEFTFENNERMTTATLWARGDRCSAIEFTTTAGRSFFHRSASTTWHTVWPVDVASGICVGMTGQVQNGQMNSLGFIFMLPIQQMQMMNMRYPTLDSEAASGIQPISVWDFRDENRGVTSKDWTNTGTYTTTQSSSWSESSGLQREVSTTVSARIPVIGSASATAGWELSESSTHETSEEVTETVEWTRSGTLEPLHWLSFQITTRRGIISLPYEATMRVTLSTGFVYTYEVRGIYRGVAYTRFDINTRTASLEDDPSLLANVTSASISRQTDPAIFTSTNRVYTAFKTQAPKHGISHPPAKYTGRTQIMKLMDQIIHPEFPLLLYPAGSSATIARLTPHGLQSLTQYKHEHAEDITGVNVVVDNDKIDDLGESSDAAKAEKHIHDI